MSRRRTTRQPALVALASAVLACAPALAQEEIRLEIGRSRVVEAAGPIGKIVIDKPGIVSARLVNQRTVELTAVKPGSIALRLAARSGNGDERFAITVTSSGPSAAEALQTQLRGDRAFERVQVGASPGGLILSGEINGVDDHARLVKLAPALAGAPVVDMMSVSGSQMVAVEVRFYAVAANTLKSLGFNFSYLGGDIQGGLLAPGTLQSFSLASTGLNIQAASPLQDAFNLLLAKPKNGSLDMMSVLSSVGLSQVLAQPTLLVRSGESADFLAGGDVPIPVPQGGGASGAVTIEYRPYGVRLSVSPVVLSDKRILLKLSPEVSELDYSNQVRIQGASVPGFRRRSTNTTVELGDGQSFVIAGLTFASNSNSEARVPGLGDLPILGALFKTSQTTHQRQELIIVATPRLVAPLGHDPLADVDLNATEVARADGRTNKVQPLDEVERLGLRR